MWEIDGQPLGQAVDVRGSHESIALNAKERQHRPEAVDDEADAAGPPVVDGCERLAVDLRLLQCHRDLFRRGPFMTSKGLQHKSEILEEILSVEQRLYRWREVSV